MGNQAGKERRSSGSVVDGISQSDYDKYSKQELGLLDKMFQSLAGRTPEDLKTISKETFLEVFRLPGFLGERLFKAFNTKKTGNIDFGEFVSGLAGYVRGNTRDKMNMLFTLFDLDSQGFITRNDLQSVLFSLVTPAIAFLPVDNAKEKKEALNYKSQDVADKIDQMVKEAFDECDNNKSGGLDPRQFRNWCGSHPEVLKGLESILIENTWAQNIDDPMYSESLYHRDLINAPPEQQVTGAKIGAMKACTHCQFQFHVGPSKAEYRIKINVSPQYFDEVTYCPICGKKCTTSEERTFMPITQGNEHVGAKRMTGMLNEANSAKLRSFTKRFVVLRGRFLYFFKSEKDRISGKSQHIHFIQGWFVEALSNHNLDSKLQNRGFKLIPPHGANQMLKILFAATPEKAKDWIHNLQVAAQTTSIQNYYYLHEKLGSGSFSEVRKGVKKSNEDVVAIKCIIKNKISAPEKEALHIEMAVMKLVKHPNVIRLYEIFESIDFIYLVMPMYTTDMYRRLTSKGPYVETDAKKIIWRLLYALQYLHALGIVHRDLKPENILLKGDDDDTDFVIADFGLSKFASPHEVMKLTCGTITYVAPEVLRLHGYGKAVDLWSTGVICFAIIRGRPPFEGREKKAIVRKILNEHPQMLGDQVWQLISPEAKDLIRRLLTKDADERPTVIEAIQHEWFEGLERLRRSELNLYVGGLICSSSPSAIEL